VKGLLENNLHKIIIMMCTIIGAIVILAIALRLAIAILLSPVFWMFAIVVLLIVLIKRKGDK
jgi:hypothetical protein